MPLDDKVFSSLMSGTPVADAPAPDMAGNAITDIIRGAAERHGVDPDVMLRLAQRESSLNPSAKNTKSSAGGLFQFIDGTWNQYGRGDKFDPAANADAAARMMRDNLDRFGGNYDAALAAHHVGPGKALAALRDPGIGDVDVSTQKWLAQIKGDRQLRDDFKAQRQAGALGDDRVEYRPDFAGTVSPNIGSRSALEALGDTGAAALKGVGNLGESLGGLYGLATGDVDPNVVQMGGKALADFAESLKSDFIKNKEKVSQQQIANADGMLNQFATAAWNNLSDPALFVNTFVEQAANFIPGMAAGRIAKGLIAGLGGASSAAAFEAASTAEKAMMIKRLTTAGQVGTGVSVATGAIMQGADAGNSAYQQVMARPQAEWDAHPEYQRLVTTLGVQGAKERIALQEARSAFAKSAVASAGLNSLAPAHAIDKMLVNGIKGRALSDAERAIAGKLAGQGTLRTAATGAAKGFAGEAVSESLDEGYGQYVANQAEAAINPNKDLTDEVGANAGLGFAFGPMGAVGGTFDALGRKKAAEEALAAAPANKPNSPLSRAASKAGLPAIDPRAQPAILGEAPRGESMADRSGPAPLEGEYMPADGGDKPLLESPQTMTDRHGNIVPAGPNFTMTGEGESPTTAKGNRERQGAASYTLGAPRAQLTYQEQQVVSAAEAEYEAAYADLIKAEQLGASDQILMQKQIAARQAEARLQEIHAAIDGNRQMETAAKRDALLSQVLDVIPPDQNPNRAFDRALRAAGFTDTQFTEAERAKIAQWQQLSDSFRAEQEQAASAPNQLDAEAFGIKAKTEPKPQGEAGARLREVEAMLNAGMVRRGDRMEDPRTGKAVKLSPAQIARAKHLEKTAERERVLPAYEQAIARRTAELQRLIEDPNHDEDQAVRLSRAIGGLNGIVSALKRGASLDEAIAETLGNVPNEVKAALKNPRQGGDAEPAAEVAPADPVRPNRGGGSVLPPAELERAQRYADDLRHMAPDAGWAEIGGRMIRDSNDNAASRTKWIPRAEWFVAGMLNSPSASVEAVRKAIAGEPMLKPERLHVMGMMDWLDAQYLSEAGQEALGALDAAISEDSDFGLPDYSAEAAAVIELEFAQGSVDMPAFLEAIGENDEQTHVAENEAGAGQDSSATGEGAQAGRQDGQDAPGAGRTGPQPEGVTPRRRHGAFESTADYTVDTEDDGDIDVKVGRLADGSVIIQHPDGIIEYNKDFAAGKSDEELLAYSYEPLGYRGAKKKNEGFGLTGQTNEEAAAEHARQQAGEPGDITKAQADKERDAVPFSMQMQSQPKPQGMQVGLFTADGRPTVAAKQEEPKKQEQGDLIGASKSELDSVAAAIEEKRRQLVALEDKMVGLAGVGRDFIEDALRSRKVPGALKDQRHALKNELANLRKQHAELSVPGNAAPTPATFDEEARAAERQALYDKIREEARANPRRTEELSKVMPAFDAETERMRKAARDGNKPAEAKDDNSPERLIERAEAVAKKYDDAGYPDHGKIIRASLKTRQPSRDNVEFWESSFDRNLAQWKTIEKANGEGNAPVEPKLRTRADLIEKDRENRIYDMVPDAVINAVLDKLNEYIKQLAAKGLHIDEVDTRFPADIKAIKDNESGLRGHFHRYANQLNAIKRGYKRADEEGFAETEQELSDELGIDVSKLREKADKASEAKQEFPVNIDVNSFVAKFPEFDGYGISSIRMKKDGDIDVVSTHTLDGLSLRKYTYKQFLDAYKSGDVKAADVTPANEGDIKQGAENKGPTVKTLMTDATFKQWQRAVPSLGKVNGWTLFKDELDGERYVLMTSYNSVGFDTEQEARDWAKDNKAVKGDFNKRDEVSIRERLEEMSADDVVALAKAMGITGQHYGTQSIGLAIIDQKSPQEIAAAMDAMAASEPNLAAAKALIQEAKDTHGDKRKEAIVRKKARELAQKTPLSDEKTVLALDMVSTRLGMGDGGTKALEFLPAVENAQKPAATAEDEAADDGEALANDFRTYPVKVLSAVIDSGQASALYKAAGVRSADAFSGLPISEQADAYAKFVQDGGTKAEGLPADYNEWVRSQEADAESRRMQGERTIRQANGKPFKTEASAQQAIERFGLTETHDVKPVEGGFELQQLTPAAQLERRRKAEGKESYIEAQEAVMRQLGIEANSEGEYDLSEAQWADVERRVDARLRGKEIQETAPAPSQNSEEFESAKAMFAEGIDELISLLGGKANLTPEEETRIIPIISKILRGAAGMGFAKFKDAARNLLDVLRAKAPELADKIELKNLQAAYINIHGMDVMQEVAAIKSLDDLYAVDADTQERIEAAEQGTNHDATPGQKEAGNYAKGKFPWNGLTISVETAKGEDRTDKETNGDKWRVTMPATYGYILGTKGADGDHLDAFMGDKPDSGAIYVINQTQPDLATFDEHKVMLGYSNEADAKADYLASFSNGFGNKVFGSLEGPFSVAEFKQMLADKEFERAEPLDMGRRLDDSTPLSEITVTVEAIEEETGRAVEMDEQADEALKDVDDRMNLARSLLECLAS